MKKKITKLMALALAGAVGLTSVFVPSVAFADGAEPEILFYRDFEDYTGGDPFNQDNSGNAYGTWEICGDGTWDGYTKAESFDGNGFYVTTSHINDKTTAFPDMSDGTLYVAFDEIPGASPKETSVYFKSGTPNFAFSYKPGTAWITSDRNWGYDKTDYMLGAGQNHRIDLVIDPSTGDAKRYINGNYIGTKNIGITTGLTEMLFRFSATSVVDNVTVVYYPENAAQQTFEVKSATVNSDDTFSVFLKGSITDPDAKGTDTKSAITAVYPATLLESELTADAFTIDGLTVTGVACGTKAGEYKISVSEEVEAGVNYTVTAKSGLEGITGAIVSESANSATAMKIVEPEVMFFRDFENYEGGDPYNNKNRTYGTWGIYGGTSYDAAEAVQGEDGIAVRNESLEKNNNLNINDGSDAFIPKKNGKLYFAFDLDTNANANATEGVYSQIVFRESGATAGKFGSDIYAFVYNAPKKQYVGGENQYTANASWQVNTSTGVSDNNKNRIELIADIDNGKIYKYINGILGAVHDDTGYSNLDDIAYMSFNPKGANIIDNLAVVHYPKGTLQQTFSMAVIEADEKTDVFRVFLKSDTVDPDGKGTTSLSEIAAPYGITLLTADASGVSYTLSDDTFSVEGMNVTSVTKGTRAGEYIVEVDGNIEAEESYTISARADLVDILGSVLNPGSVSKTVTVAPKLAAEVAVAGEAATVVFNDDISNPMEYSKGATVKNVYTGETGAATLTKSASNKAVIGGYAFAAGDEYEVTLPDTIRGKKGNSLSDNTVMFNLATTNSLKKITLVDIQGNKLDLSEVNPVELESIDFEFTGDVTASAKTIAITDDGGAEFTDYTAVPANNKTSLKLNKILAPGKTYTVSVSGLGKAYAITLNTEAAKFERVGVQFIDGNGNAIERVSVGDTVKVKMSFVNSTNAEKTFLASASMFAGLEMTGFAHKEITMKPASDGGTGTHTETFTFTVSKTTGGVKLNGYMWSVTGGKFAPITAFESFE